MNDLPQLSTFVSVATTGSFTKTANKLDISPTAVSKQIDQLEKTLGVTLFERTTRHLFITEIGKAILEKAVDALNTIEEIKQFSASLKKEPSGTLNISSLVAAGDKFILPHLDEFLEKYPSISVNLQLEDRIPSFENNVDILFGTTPTYLTQLKDQASIIATPLFSAKRIICAAPSYLKKHGTPKTIQDLTQHCYIGLNFYLGDLLLTEMKKQKINFKRVVNFNNTFSVLKSGLQGTGIIQALDIVANDHIKAGQLIPLLPELHSPVSDRYMLYKKQRYIEPKVLLFKEFILKKICLMLGKSSRQT